MKIRFSKHALDRWRSRALNLGLNSSIKEMEKTFKKAVPERPINRTVRWNLFKRSIIHGKTNFLIARGWRFVITGDGMCVEVERIKPHENFKRTGGDTVVHKRSVQNRYLPRCT